MHRNIIHMLDTDVKVKDEKGDEETGEEGQGAKTKAHRAVGGDEGRVGHPGVAAGVGS